MTAPTVPTAPLPSLLRCPFCGSEAEVVPVDRCEDDDPVLWVVGCNDSKKLSANPFRHVCLAQQTHPLKADAIRAWNLRSDAALLTMQRERDEALTKLNSEENAHAELQARCFDNGQPTGGSIFGEIVELRGHLGACKQQLAASERTCAELREDLATVSAMRSGLIQKVEALIARAEAAERTVEGWKLLCEEMLEAMNASGCYDDHLMVMNKANQAINTTARAQPEDGDALKK